MGKKIISTLVCALFAFCLMAIAGVAAQDTQKITGTVMSVEADTGEVMCRTTPAKQNR